MKSNPLRREWLFVGAVSVLALALRLYGLAGESAWFDEVVSLRHLDQPTLRGFLRSVRAVDPPLMPCYFILEYYWAHLVSGSVTGVRLLSVFLGTGAVPMLYFLGRRLHSPRAGLIAALCQACALPHILYSQEVRMYALFMLLTAASIYTFVRAVEKTAMDAPRLSPFLPHFAVNALLLGTHLYAPLIVLAEGIFLMLFHRRRRAWILLWGLAHAALFVPWAYWVATIDFAGVFTAADWIPPLDPGWLGAFFLFLTGGRILSDPRPDWHRSAALYLGRFWWVDRALAGLMALVIAAWIIKAIRTALRGGKGEEGKRGMRPLSLFPSSPFPLLPLLWFGTPLTVLGCLSLAWRPCLFDRYVLNTSLALYVLFGAGVASWPRASARRVVLTLTIGLYLFLFVALPKPWRGDWRFIGDYIQTHGAITDLVAVSDEVAASSLAFNAPLLGDCIYAVQSHEEIEAAEARAFSENRDFWLGPVMPTGVYVKSFLKFLTDVRKTPYTLVEVPALNGCVFIHVPYSKRHPPHPTALSKEDPYPLGAGGFRSTSFLRTDMSARIISLASTSSKHRVSRTDCMTSRSVLMALRMAMVGRLTRAIASSQQSSIENAIML